MTDPALLEKKLAFIETCVSELQRLAVDNRVTRDVLENHLAELLEFARTMRTQRS